MHRLVLGASAALLLAAPLAAFDRAPTLETELAAAREQIAIMKAGGPYPTAWLANRWLKARDATSDPDARSLFERVFLEQSLLSMRAELDADGQAAFRAALKPEVDAQLRSNEQWLNAALARIGWFDISRYGEDASQAAWLIVQHADHDPEWQKAVLADLEPRVKRGDMQGRYYAYLIDRVAVNAGQPQTYGTQGGCVGAGDWQPKAVAAPEALDQRRAEVGLEPIAAYRARFTAECK